VQALRVRFTLRRMMAAVAALAVVALVMKVVGDRFLWPPTRLGPITTLGRHVITPGEFEVEVVEVPVRVMFSLNYRPAWWRGWDYWNTTDPWIEKGAKWFAFVESRDRLWVYDGNDCLGLWTLRGGSIKGVTYRTTGDFPGLVASAPEGVRDLLPKAFRDKARQPVSRLGLVTRPGRHVVTPGEFEFEFYEQDEGSDRIRCDLSFGPTQYRRWQTWGPYDPVIRKGSKWFAYVETPNRVWVFDGVGVLGLWSLSPGRAKDVTYQSTEDTPGLLGSAPKAVKDLLPEAIKNVREAG
jgi:hypothetical protein